MANYDGFEKASYYGNKGERVALELLERNGFTTKDVSSHPNFFTAGDIIATKNNQNYFIEVKTDTTAHKSQNLVIEFSSNVEAGRDGWFHTSTADKFFFYLIGSNEMIILDGPELRTYYKKALTRILETTQCDNCYTYKTGVIGLLSISELQKLCKSFRRIQL